MSCGVGHRRGSGPALLWLWRRLVTTAPIGPLAWEHPYATGAAQEMAKRQKKKIYMGRQGARIAKTILKKKKKKEERRRNHPI